ncbi:hypothetical protein HN51_024733 [Arachis hypogaea]|uniref:RING-type domain-containing protein n=2 Tax=Arachis TaxID=3817 RepID=A0A445C808_ARAHY|nr:hypothetical protein Ahy_A07g032946 [Arachis hypogaea]
MVKGVWLVGPKCQLSVFGRWWGSSIYKAKREIQSFINQKPRKPVIFKIQSSNLSKLFYLPRWLNKFSYQFGSLFPCLLILLDSETICCSKLVFESALIKKMGLSSLPSPSEGVLCALLVNTVLSVSIFKGIVRTILHIVGIHLSSSSSPNATSQSHQPSESFEFLLSPSETFIEEFRSRTPTIRFDSMFSCGKPEHDCCVCLSQFEPESEINRLPCGHLFHKVCLEKWLDYWNITCPLCRNPLMPEDNDPWLLVSNE